MTVRNLTNPVSGTSAFTSACDHCRYPAVIFWLLVSLAGVACSTRPVSMSNEGLLISHIKVNVNATTDVHRARISGYCGGFLLNEQMVSEFFVNSHYIKDTAPENRYDILPCYSTGTAKINGKNYEWVIRAGGVGKFTSANHEFVRICGAGCCEKVKTIC